jgi:arsenate reductase-like glutaredoxin family protein
MINIQIFGSLKDNSTKKAIRFFKERNIKPHIIDLREKNLSKGELENITRKIPLEELIDTEGKEYKRKNLAFMKFDIAEELLENSLLVKMPIVRSGKNVTIGYEPKIWEEWLKE